MQDFRCMQSRQECEIHKWKTRQTERENERKKHSERLKKKKTMSRESLRCVQDCASIMVSVSFRSQIHNLPWAMQPVKKKHWSSTWPNAQKRTSWCVQLHALSWDNPNRSNCFFFFPFVPRLCVSHPPKYSGDSWAGGERMTVSIVEGTINVSNMIIVFIQHGLASSDDFSLKDEYISN